LGGWKYVAQFLFKTVLQECKIIIKNLEAKFERWLCLLLEGFSLLLYGLGTKAELLNSLRKFLASNEDDAIVVNGFFPSLTLREVSPFNLHIGSDILFMNGFAQILSSIVRDVMEMPTVPTDEHECCNLILRHFNRSDSQHLYLLINNLDGQALQTSKAQNCIARLSTANKIHLVCTIDHINAPLRK
jgi:origin recognition complex subunit 2